jgi:transposase
MAGGFAAEPVMIGGIGNIWLAVEPVDMRAGVERLSQLVQNSLGRNPCDGNAYVFRNRSSTRLKLLVWDGNGVWLCQRRLHRGRFHWPSSQEGTFLLTEDQWSWLTQGLQWQRIKAMPPLHWRV